MHNVKIVLNRRLHCRRSLFGFCQNPAVTEVREFNSISKCLKAGKPISSPFFCFPVTYLLPSPWIIRQVTRSQHSWFCCFWNARLHPSSKKKTIEEWLIFNQCSTIFFCNFIFFFSFVRRTFCTCPVYWSPPNNHLKSLRGLDVKIVG